MNKNQLKEIPLDHIHPDPDQPRSLPNTLGELIERKNAKDRRVMEIWPKIVALSTSILEVGLQQPISVYPNGEPDQYMILDGHRRWLAASLLNRQKQFNSLVPCYIHPKPSENDILLSQLNVNLQRDDFNVFELARSLQLIYSDLSANGGVIRTLSADGNFEVVELEAGEPDQEIWEAIERKMGISRSRRYQIQAVLKLPESIQKMVEKANLPESRIRYLSPIKDSKIQEQIAQEMIDQNLSNSQIKKRIKELQKGSIQPISQKQDFNPSTQGDKNTITAKIKENVLVGEPSGHISSDIFMPKPITIQSAIRPIRELATNLGQVHNVPAAISAKDPRTVESYKKVLPELRDTLEDLEIIIKELEYLEKT